MVCLGIYSVQGQMIIRVVLLWEKGGVDDKREGVLRNLAVKVNLSHIQNQYHSTFQTLST